MMINPRRKKNESLEDFNSRAAKAYYANGFSILEVAKKLDISNSEAWNYCTDTKRKFITPDVRYKVIYLKSQGLSYTEIGRLLNISRTSCRRIIKGSNNKYDSLSTDLITDKIIALRIKNYSIDKIAKELNISRNIVHYKLSKAGYKPNNYNKKLSDKEVRTILFLHKSGFSMREIAAKCDKSLSTVFRYIKKSL